MDGTFYLGSRLLDGSREFIERLTASGRDYKFFTNNSSNNVAVCRAKLENMGFPVDENRAVISTHVTADLLSREYPGCSVYLLGNERLTADFVSAGICLTQDKPDVVVLGFDTTLNYEKIQRAAEYIDGGAVYIATHPDKNCPVDGGFMPDTGSMIELFAASTGKRPRIVGKPSIDTVKYLTALLGCERDELAFAGDRLETDIAIGAGIGIPTVLVLSGVTTREQAECSPIKPDVIVPRLVDVCELL